MVQDRQRSRQGTYVYGVVPSLSFNDGDQPISAPAVGDPSAPVRTVVYEDLAAVVSDFPGGRCDINRENLLAHQRVLEEVTQRSDVLPVSFGTVAASDADVRDKLLRRGLEDLRAHLEYLRGRVELELKVLWNRDALFAEIAAEHDDIRALRDALAGRPPDSAYHERIRLGELTAAAIGDKSEAEAGAILDALEPLAVDTVLNRNLSDMMVLNVSFLVERALQDEFDARVQQIGIAQEGRLTFQYVGPLPAYNFVNLNVEWAD
ncbi:MAG: GvpL/GvpF family gas vesicle protein [Chloroflexota bacterium]|nr:GvpL/GvpF family gas vesicle protein [Chloroflexota bacterium]